MREALYLDTLIQNSLVRASPQEIEEMEPGVIVALLGLWQGRAKYTQEMTPNQKKPKKSKKPNATRSR